MWPAAFWLSLRSTSQVSPNFWVNPVIESNTAWRARHQIMHPPNGQRLLNTPINQRLDANDQPNANVAAN